jgi:hypothetical protein
MVSEFKATINFPPRLHHHHHNNNKSKENAVISIYHIKKELCFKKNEMVNEANDGKTKKYTPKNPQALI